jgi:hypothetical protein
MRPASFFMGGGGLRAIIAPPHRPAATADHQSARSGVDGFATLASLSVTRDIPLRQDEAVQSDQRSARRARRVVGG